ncbi:MAG: adenosylcobinamide-phosphate synthase CbiB [Alphaproteobacteria bacterium]
MTASPSPRRRLGAKRQRKATAHMLIPGSEICGIPIAAVLLLAMMLDAVIGDYPFKFVPHPVALLGRAIEFFDDRLNRAERGHKALVVRGALVTTLLAGSAAGLGWYLAGLGRGLPCGWWFEVPLVAIFLAGRGLFDHVRAVAQALPNDDDDNGDVEAGREAVSHIVGRNPKSLDNHGVARAAIESLAENFSDGIVAPALFYLLFGLPGLLLYKTVNTLDSMIGHHNERYEAFGKVAARLDDLLNLVPARLGGLLIAAGAIPTPGGHPARALWVMAGDAGKSRSPNAGWLEAAMAGAIGVALLGPRKYGRTIVKDPWIGEQFSARVMPRDIRRALFLFVIACGFLFAAVGLVAVLAA